MAEHNDEYDGLIQNRDLVYIQPADAKSQSEIDRVSEAPLWPLNVKEFITIVFTLLKAGIPSSFALVASELRGLISLVLVGRYASLEELAGASLATSLGNMFIMTLAFTINTGFAVSGSQLNGAGRLDELKVFFQRHSYVLTTLFTPILLILSFSNYILIALDIDAQISNNTVEYFRLTLISWICAAFQDFLRSFLMVQHIYTIIGVIQVASLVLHVLLCFLFVFQLEMPFIGPALVRSITDFIVVAVLLIYALRNPKMREMMTSWSRQCLYGWWPHLKQMVILGFDVFVDSVLLEFSLLIVIYINDHYVISAHSIALNIVSILFVIPLGNSVAMQTKIGNAVGENLKYKAKKFMAGGLFLNLLVCCFFALVVLIWNEDIVNEMTSIPETNAILKQFLYIYNVVYFGDSFKDHLAGVLKTIGKEKDVFKIYLGCNIAVGLICQWLLALLLGFGYLGVWLGIAISMYITSGGLIMRLMTLNWDKQIEQIQTELKGLDTFDEGEDL